MPGWTFFVPGFLAVVVVLRLSRRTVEPVEPPRVEDQRDYR